MTYLCVTDSAYSPRAERTFTERIQEETLAQGHPDAMLSQRIPNLWFPTSGYFILCTPPITEHTVRVDLTPPHHHSWHKANHLHWSHAPRAVTDSQCSPIFNIWSTGKSLSTSSWAKPMPKPAAVPHVAPCMACLSLVATQPCGSSKKQKSTLGTWLDQG